MEAKERGAKVIHVDPRFTRTSALADLHVPIRAGSDIAFLGGIVNYILEHERWFREYVDRLHERRDDHQRGLRRHRGPRRPVLGLRPGDGLVRHRELAVRGRWRRRPPPASATRAAHGRAGARRATAARLEAASRPPSTTTLQHPRCVFQLLKKHFRRYTPEMVEETCGIPKEPFLEVAEALCANSGRERTSAFVYSVGWTQHTVGVQYIRTAAIIQLLLGNMGRPGGGILALRGHASIQGSTDIPTLYNILPGLPPDAASARAQDRATYVELNTPPTGYWGHARRLHHEPAEGLVGDAATEENDYCFDHLPRITGDHSIYPTILDMLDGKVQGFFLLGENPAVGSAQLRSSTGSRWPSSNWLVVRDFQEIESASFWYDAPEIETGELVTEEIGTEVFFMPAAAHTEKDGSFTNTQRLLQWHHKAVEPQGDCRSELWFTYHLGRRIREKLRGATTRRTAPMLDLHLGLPDRGRSIEEPERRRGAAGDQRLRTPTGSRSRRYTELKADGSTACGCWIYCGSLRRRREPDRRAASRAASRAGSRPSGAGRGR